MTIVAARTGRVCAEPPEQASQQTWAGYPFDPFPTNER